MKTKFIHIWLLFVGVQLHAQHLEKHEKIAKEFFACMVKKDYEGCWKYTDKELKKKYSIEKLTVAINAILSEMRNYTTQLAPMHTMEWSTDLKTKKEYTQYYYHTLNQNGEESTFSLRFTFRNDAKSKVVAVVLRAK